jgi:hypothetical protein
MESFVSQTIFDLPGEVTSLKNVEYRSTESQLKRMCRRFCVQAILYVSGESVLNHG